MTTTHPQVTTEHTEITPELAAKWLEDFNRHNRPIFPWHWRDLAEDMLSGRFLDTGENGVSFDWDGYICGGQHTLTAIVHSGCAVRLRVSRNVDPAARQVMNDTLKQRFAHDLATMGANRNANQMESLTRVALLWDRTAQIYRGKGGIATYRTAAKYTRSVLTSEWPKYAASVTETMDSTSPWNNTQVWPGNRGAMQMIYWTLRYRFDCSHEAIAGFFTKICYGTDDLNEGVLFLKLKNKYNENQDKHIQVYWTLRVWNAVHKGETLTKLQAPRDSIDPVTGKMTLADPYPRALKVR
jgi:hypothetical protein